MAKKIVIYGLGVYGKKITEIIMRNKELLDIDIVTLCDIKQLKYKNMDVILPKDLMKYEYDFIVVTSTKWYEEIKDNLVTIHKVNPQKIILYSKLFEDGNYHCNVCEHNIKMFLPGGEDVLFYKQNNVIGGGVREQCNCPMCESKDRSRWLLYILNQYTSIFDGHNSILHFAPEKGIEEKIRNSNEKYITADIVEGLADVVEDITSLSFKNDSFDYIICNHVMEHILDESKALSELRRCIRGDGKIVLSVPICWEQKTIEDKNILTSDERLRLYGQKDHVRLYGYDFKDRIEKFGFNVKQYTFSVEDFPRLSNYGLIQRDTIWILERN